MAIQFLLGLQKNFFFLVIKVLFFFLFRIYKYGTSIPWTNLRGGQLSRTGKSKKSETLQKPATTAARSEGFSAEYGAVRDSETEPLLSWLYSYPDKKWGA